MRSRHGASKEQAAAVAGNGPLDRRALLTARVAGVGAAVSTGAAADPLTEPDWGLVPGEPMPPYQVPSSFEKNVTRLIDNPNSLPQISHARMAFGCRRIWRNRARRPRSGRRAMA